MQSVHPNLTTHDFFHNYIFSGPVGCMHLKKKDQGIVLAAKRILSTLTLGILPFICKKLWGKIEHSEAKIRELAQKLNQCNFFKVPKFDENDKKNSQLIQQAKNTDCNRILNGLFLGSSSGFVEATTLKFPVLNGCRLYVTQFTNRYQFNSVVTMCPLEAIQGDFTELDMKLLESNFSRRKITWLNAGNDLIDHHEAGFDLAYNSTYINSSLIQKTLVGLKDEEIEKISRQKRTFMERLHIQKWFAPVFVEMDKAILGRGNTLVHCQAGISRSATVVAAYLINRFNLSADDAINYLKNKRQCVNPKFGNFLRQYEQLMKFQH